MIDNQRCILVVDDEPKMIRALVDFFKANQFYVLEASDGEEAIDLFCEYNNQIDIVLLDVMMPKKDGFAVLRELRDMTSFVPVIMLTAKGEEYDQLAGFLNGADDYITKPFSPSLLLARVETVLRRLGKDVQQDIVRGGIVIQTTKRTVFVDGTEVELTRREFDLLCFFALNSKIIFSREQLLNNVWGYDFDGGVRTVDTHIRFLRAKLGKCADYIKTIHCVGYVFEVSA